MAFNSRPHEEVDLYSGYPETRSKAFNSRPHEEVDFNDCNHSSTVPSFQFTTSRGGRRHDTAEQAGHRHLSIHDLTRRSTCEGAETAHDEAAFNSRPHEEVDRHALSPVYCHLAFQFTTSRGGRQTDRGIELTTGDFQFTTSRGGRLLDIPPYPADPCLSIHDLTRRSTREAE